jgi:hypothetical protein
MDAWIEETEACVRKMEANREKPDAVPEHQEVPNEEAAVETIGALQDRYGERHLAVGRRWQPKERIQGDGASRQKLSSARGRMTCRAIPAPRKGNGRQGPGRDNVAQGASKGQTFEKRHRA